MTTLSKLYTTAFEKNWNSTVFSDFDGGDFTYSEAAGIIKSLHLYYQVSGIRKGDKIAVLGRNSARWGSIFLSVITSGAIIVPVLPDFSVKDTNHILNHSESKIVFVSRTLVDKIDPSLSEHLQTIIILEDFSVYQSSDESTAFKIADAFEYYTKNQLKPSDLNFFEWGSEECCIISYTSGTSGFTKGVMIPERSLVSNIVYAQEHMPLLAGHKIVSFLPMAHVY